MTESYATKQGDTWDMISYTVYGSEMHIDYLAANNPELLDYLVLPAGVVVQTPALPEDSSAISVPAWRVSP